MATRAAQDEAGTDASAPAVAEAASERARHQAATKPRETSYDAAGAAADAASDEGSDATSDASATDARGGAIVDDASRRERIAQAAYYLAMKRGFDGDRQVEDWLEAERLVDEGGATPAA
ncbi:MAG: DUF2934 domain-containing protein [Lautropia sp.]